MNTPTETFAPVTIGTSPAGVLWVAYKAEHVEPMTARLAVLKSRRVRTVKISANQCAVLEDMFSLREDGSEAAYTLGATFIRGRACDLEDLADDVQSEASARGEFAADCAGDSLPNPTDAQIEFAYCAGYAGILNLASKLRGGLRVSARAAKQAARREYRGE